MLNMQRVFGRNIAYFLFQRSNNHSQVASFAARTVSDKKFESTKVNVEVQSPKASKGQNALVAAAFAALKEEGSDLAASPAADEQHTVSLIDEMIINSKTTNGLLTISESNNGVLTRKQALKIVSILAEWSSINKVKLSEFETDPRFIKLCRLLGRATTTKNGNANHPKKNIMYRTEDLNTVLGVTGDDEAAKLVANISVPQMVKVMSSLAAKKRRSITLLRAIAYNISGSSTNLDLKQASDLLFAMAVLNFPDPVLTDRICADVQSVLPLNKEKSAVVGSVLTSLGLLRYRDTTALEALTDWVLKNYENCRPQDVLALFYTLAILNYPTSQIEEIKNKLMNNFKLEDATKSTEWLNYVWSLVALDISQPQHIDSVLKREFLEKLVIERQGNLTPTIKMKLLNINAYARTILKDYKGSQLSGDSVIFETPLAHSKEKQQLVNGMLDALKSLMSIENYVKTHVDTKMGFVIDAECIFDPKGNPVALEKATESCKRIAIMLHDYHDMCQGIHQSLNGVSNLTVRLLENSNYTVISVPHTECSISEKLLKRVQYLESKLKPITKSLAPSK